MELSLHDRPDHTVGLCKEKGWGLFALCSEGHRGRIPLDLPDGVTLGAIAERLVCRCGARQGQVYTQQVGGGNGGVPPTYRE